MSLHSWHGLQPVEPRQWTCGHCGLIVAGNLGYYRNDGMKVHPNQVPQQGGQLPAHLASKQIPRILLCPQCAKPTYFEGVMQVPGAAFGNRIEHLPPDVEGLYTEARNCVAVNSFTSAVLACRKMLMHIAVAQGAPEGLKFQPYVEYLAAQGYVPPNGKAWVDHIRTRGNEATHEIVLMKREDAEQLLTFVASLLMFVYELPAKVPPVSP